MGPRSGLDVWRKVNAIPLGEQPLVPTGQEAVRAPHEVSARGGAHSEHVFLRMTYPQLSHCTDTSTPPPQIILAQLFAALLAHAQH